MSDKKMMPILQVGNVLVSPDIITEKFCCDLDACKGICCVEGDAGAPVSMEEIAAIEDVVDTVWGDLSASAQSVIDKQGIAYTDRDGDLVTSIVHGKDCVFTFYDKECCLCALERSYRAKKTNFVKPISCALYPIRLKVFNNNLIGLNYHKWDICKDAVIKGKELNLPIYKFLKGPLIRRFGKEWYTELEAVAKHLLSE
ncbi:DUF3109 family protein [Prevotella pallens]|jgi:hypothetical protein|uniref:DUF3109 family protein n=1 Tax=Prevotella pallens TaxID=60133 RepID=UPI001CB459F1|nr:DUF3109 family protein [Prevotella pallens]MBF1464087.1 DUF3109 family protein [Prevotella pallens]